MHQHGTCLACGAAVQNRRNRRFCSRECFRSGATTPLESGPDTASLRLPLFARDGSIRAYALIDSIDAPAVRQYRWHVGSSGYASHSVYQAGGNPFELKLHRLILGLEPGDGLEGDHINRDRLDNRRANLRIVSQDENAQNRNSNRGSTSRYRGVSLFRGTGKWVASVRVNGRLISLGYYTDEHEAGRVAREARARLLPYATD